MRRSPGTEDSPPTPSASAICRAPSRQARPARWTPSATFDAEDGLGDGGGVGLRPVVFAFRRLAVTVPFAFMAIDVGFDVGGAPMAQLSQVADGERAACASSGWRAAPAPSGPSCLRRQLAGDGVQPCATDAVRAPSSLDAVAPRPSAPCRNGLEVRRRGSGPVARRLGGDQQGGMADSRRRWRSLPVAARSRWR